MLMIAGISGNQGRQAIVDELKVKMGWAESSQRETKDQECKHLDEGTFIFDSSSITRSNLHLLRVLDVLWIIVIKPSHAQTLPPRPSSPSTSPSLSLFSFLFVTRLIVALLLNPIRNPACPGALSIQI